MGVLNSKNEDLFDSIAEVLHQHTIDGTVKWVHNKTHMFSNDREKYLVAHMDGQKFQLTIKIENGSCSDGTAMSVWDDTLNGDFVLNSGTDPIKKLGNLVFDKYIKDDLELNKESDVLNGILSKIGKNIIREKRLSILLDKDTNKEKETNSKKPS